MTMVVHQTPTIRSGTYIAVQTFVETKLKEDEIAGEVTSMLLPTSLHRNMDLICNLLQRRKQSKQQQQTLMQGSLLAYLLRQIE